MMMTGVDLDRGYESSEFSDSSDIVGTPGVVPFTWEEEPGRPKTPTEIIFDSVISQRESLRESASKRAPEVFELDTSTSDSEEEDRSLEAQVMKLNLRASLMGVHILDDETEMFFTRQVSNASSKANSNGTPFRSPVAIPFKWEMEPGKPFEAVARQDSPPVGPLLPPPGSRPVSGLLSNFSGPQYLSRPASGLLYSGQFNLSRPTSGALYSSGQLYGLGPDDDADGVHQHLSEKLFKKLVGQSRVATNPTTTNTQLLDEGLPTTRMQGKSSTETLDRHFGHYDSDLRIHESSSVSPTSTLDHHQVDSPYDYSSSPESSTSSIFDRYYPTRSRNTLSAFLSTSQGRSQPSSQLAQCLLSLTAMADDTTDDDDIIVEHPSTSAPIVLWHPQEQPAEPHPDWPIVQYVPQPSKPQHGHPQQSPTRTFERWSSNTSSWNLTLVQPKPKKPSMSGSKQSGSGVISRQEFHHRPSTSTTTILTYDRSGDMFGRHKWERDSSVSSLPSVDEERGFEPYDRPEEVVHALDEDDFPFSPIASSFVFGEHNNSVEFSQRGGRAGIPRAVGPIVQEFTMAPHFDVQEYRNSLSNSSEASLTYSLEGGILQPEQEWIPTKSFHYIKGQGVEILDLGCSSRVFNGYIEIGNHSGRFSIDLQRGPRLERHRSHRVSVEKTPEVLLRLVNEANNISQKKRSNAKYGCFSQCICLPVPKKGFLGRCLTTNPRPRLAVANSFEARLGSRTLGSVSENAPTGPFQFF